MHVSAPDLDRVIQNALLYVNEKSVRVVHVLFLVLDNRLIAYSTDDYIAVTDSCPVVDQAGKIWTTLSIADAKLLGEWIKKDKKVVHKYDIKIQKKFTGILFECEDTSTDDGSDNIFFPLTPEHKETWDLVFELLAEDAFDCPVSFLAIKPERLAKLARLKADKEAPIDLRGVEIRGHPLVQFKKGDTITGCIMPVDRSKVDDRFLW
jgi:hypothetical protein